MTGLPSPRARAKNNLIFGRDAQGQNVDQRIAGVAGLEFDFAADRGHAETVAVKGDAANHAVDEAAIARDDFGCFGHSPA